MNTKRLTPTERLDAHLRGSGLSAVTQAAAAVAAASSDLKRAMRKARAEGATFSAIGAAAGVSKQRVHQIVTKP